MGEYDLDYNDKDRIEVKFGTDKRKEIFEVDMAIPGPQHYKPILVQDSNEIMFPKQKRESFDAAALKRKTPAPNEYDPKL